MKKKAIKKLSLSKINIASLTATAQAKINGGETRPKPETLTIDGPNDTLETRCVFCIGGSRYCG